MVSFIRYEKMFGLYELIQPYLKYSLPVEERLPVNNVLVIAPHQDDESIGCGGTVFLHAKNNGRASVVFCTSDGKIREDESAEALKALGVSDSLQLGYKIETLKSEAGLGARLASIIDEKKPEIVFIPFFIDNHEDHRAVNSALAGAYTDKQADFMIYAYPVWFPLYPNVLVDIGRAWEKKKQAIECYRSQIATRDYVKMARSLGEYWAEVKGHGIKNAETYFKATAKEYFSLVRKSIGV